MNQNPYHILHLDEDATYEEIRQRYKHLTKNLHPDKQPLENYQMAKKHFELVDQAYKKIGSPLRRFLFRQFGQQALKIIDQFPYILEEFDKEELTPAQQNDLKQLIIYFLYEQQASNEADKSKVINKSMINVSRTVRLGPPNKKYRGRGIDLETCSFEYETTLPKLFQFSNTFAIIQQISNLKTDPRSHLTFALSSSRRIYEKYMLTLQASTNENQNNFDASIQGLAFGNTLIRFTPISISNGELTYPKVTFQRAFYGFSISGSSDLHSHAFQYSQPHNKKWTKSLKLQFQDSETQLTPRLQYELNSRLRLYVQMSFGLQGIGQNKLNLTASIQYGYKLKINDDLRLQLSSVIGSQNYYQISFISNKYRVMVPLFCELGNGQSVATFEMYKLIGFVGTYFCVQLYSYVMKRNAKFRERLKKEQLSRINEQKHQLNKTQSYIELQAQQSRERQTKQRGLVILKAYIGQYSKISKIQKAIKKIKVKQGSNKMEEYLNAINRLVEDGEIKVGELEDEIDEVTALVQVSVIGGQLLHLNLNDFQKINPSIDENDQAFIYIAYCLRGEVGFTKKKAAGYLNIGGLTQKYSHSNTSRLFSFFKDVVNYIL